MYRFSCERIEDLD